MKPIFLSIALVCLTTITFAQRTPAQLKLKSAPGLSVSFRSLAGPVLGVKDPCKGAPFCVGIIDPWTCECDPEVKDPWEDDKIAAKMRAVQKLESAMASGQGKEFLPASLVATAKRKYPGKSAKAIHQRAVFYAKAAARK